MPHKNLPARTFFQRAALCAGVVLAAPGAARAAPPLAYVTSETVGVGVIDLDRLSLIKTFPVGADGPRGLSLTADGARLLVANKNTGDLSVIDTGTGAVLQRVKIGKNPEYVRVHGDFAYVTHEPGGDAAPAAAGGNDAKGAKGAKGDDDDDANKPPAEISIVDLKSLRVITSVKSGHETEGVEFSRDGNTMLVTNEGDDTISVYDARTGTLQNTVKLPAGGRPRGVKASPDGKVYVVTLESASKFVVLDAGDFRILKTVDTKLGPYGVAFGPAGKRLLIAAARDKTLQVFDAQTYAPIADVPIGARCWHFTFSPDGATLLAACGRSNAVLALDAKTYQPIKEIGGLPLAWGIVTYPAGDGSIESP
jgi:YVTN family beta-propeller protein